MSCCRSPTVVQIGGDAQPSIDPNACNALVDTGSGLLVPRSVLEGIAPGGAVGPDRSVDVDVTAPAAGDCPETWQIGARLSPVSGEVVNGSAVLTSTASGAWVTTGLQVVLPEAGSYELTADVRAFATVLATGSNFIISARLFNVTAAAALPSTERVVLQAATTAGGLGVNMSNTAPVHTFITVAGPTTVRLEGRRVDVIAGGGISTAIWSDSNGGTTLGFKKVSD